MIGRWCNRKEWKPSDVFLYVLFFFYVSRGDLPKRQKQKETGKPVFHENFRQYIKSLLLKSFKDRNHTMNVSGRIPPQGAKEEQSTFEKLKLTSFHHWYTSCFIWSWCFVHTITIDGYVGPTIVSNRLRY